MAKTGFDRMKVALSLSENVRAMAIRSLVTELFFGMFYVVWQPYVIELGATLPQLGLVQGIMILFAAAGSLLWGRLSDVWGRKPVIVASIFCRLIAGVFALAAQNWVHFIGFGAFMGLSATWQQTNPAESSLIAESVESSRVGTAISVYMSIGLMASITTASLGGYLALNQGYWIIFLSCIAGELFNTFFVSMKLNETLERNSVIAKSNGTTRTGLMDLVSLESTLIPFYAINFIGSFSYGASNSILYALLVDGLGFNTVQLGIMSTLFGLSWGLSQLPIGWLMDRYGRKTFLLLSEVANVIVMVGYISSREFPVFLILQIFSGLAHAMWIPAHIALVAERIPAAKRSLAMGKLSTFPLLLAIPAPYLGGLLYESFGFSAPMMVRLASVLCSLVVIFIFINEKAKSV